MLLIGLCCPLCHGHTELDWCVQIPILECTKANSYALQIPSPIFIEVSVDPWGLTNTLSSGTMSTRGLPSNSFDFDIAPPILFKITVDLAFYGLEQMERCETYPTAIWRHLGIVQNHPLSKKHDQDPGALGNWGKMSENARLKGT